MEFMTSGSPPGAILPSLRTLGSVWTHFGLSLMGGRGTGIRQIDVKDTAKYPTMQGTALPHVHTAKTHPAPNFKGSQWRNPATVQGITHGPNGNPWATDNPCKSFCLFSALSQT